MRKPLLAVLLWALAAAALSGCSRAELRRCRSVVLEQNGVLQQASEVMDKAEEVIQFQQLRYKACTSSLERETAARAACEGAAK